LNGFGEKPLTLPRSFLKRFLYSFLLFFAVLRVLNLEFLKALRGELEIPSFAAGEQHTVGTTPGLCIVMNELAIVYWNKNS
jgi:hypothetical protein